MENNVSIQLFNGMGDKFLDLIGFYVLCKYCNYKPDINFFNNGHYAWGNNNYDLRLFHFHDFTINSHKNQHFFVNSTNPSSSLCPYKVYEFIQQFTNTITFEQISNDFVYYAKQIIQPSEIILAKIPKNVEKAYGIHLRKSDKLNDMGDIRHENKRNEFDIITTKLLEDVEDIIFSEEEPVFLIVSEDNNWKMEITNRINNFSQKNNKNIQILTIDYSTETNYHNFNSVLDMFCLSRCKEILQGVKYSTFSILASLLGNNKLRNYAKYTTSFDICLIHSWSSVLNINNNNKNLDLDLHRRVTMSVENITTNINRIYT
jgi:hypothetical protein